MKSHQMAGTREYLAWQNMKSRCSNPKNSRYHRYGGRGIKVCDAWATFEVFYADMGPCNGLTIDRINNDGHYEPSNCRWIPHREQPKKSSRIRLLSHNDETKSVADWARTIGIKAHALSMRLNSYGWPVEKALTTGRRK